MNPNPNYNPNYNPNPTNVELTMLINSMVYLNNYIRTVNSSIEYLNNASANIRHMQETMYYHYHANNYQLMVNNTELFARANNGLANSVANSVANNIDIVEDLNLEYFEALSLRNLQTIITNNVTECSFCSLCEPLNESCSITHEDFLPQHRVTKINGCGHIFNSRAINEWLLTHQSCPNCRYNILSDSNIISYSIQESDSTFYFNIEDLIKFFRFINQSS
jgi:hypothetical protein